jgi:hypothetical protein
MHTRVLAVITAALRASHDLSGAVSKSDADVDLFFSRSPVIFSPVAVWLAQG